MSRFLRNFEGSKLKQFCIKKREGLSEQMEDNQTGPYNESQLSPGELRSPYGAQTKKKKKNRKDGGKRE